MKVIKGVNNYLDGSERQPGDEPGWCFLTDSSVTNTGKPFYLPDNMGRVTVALTSAVRINRLGKSIGVKYAERYYSESAPALEFQLPEYEERLKRAGLPADAAFNFDRAIFVGDFSTFDPSAYLEVFVNGRKATEFRFENLFWDTATLISKVSVMNTMKIGDLILPGSTKGVDITIGDFIELRRNGEKAFEVKVK